ncbi:site-specific integrase [Nocardia terpenica]|uniref:site-specific integrase n=1 Tax=Nocardia terpenica TaxID=455432 RepID=UPI0015836A96|nr:site-specific integrase [Nocardia terpenica]
MLDLAHYGELFTTDRYPSDLRLWHGATAAQIAGDRPTGENKTQPVALDILNPLLAASLFLIDTVGPHLLPLHRQVTAHTATRNTSWRYADEQQIESALRWHQASGEPLRELPTLQLARRQELGWSPDDPLLTVSFGALAEHTGCTDVRWNTFTPALRTLTEETLALVGMDKPWARNAPLVAHADTGEPVPWTLPLHTKEVVDLVQITRTACAATIAAVTGMRSSELMELRLGCRQTPEQIRPGMFRYRLTSTIIKGKPLGGIDDQWVVTEEVFRAIELAEQLCATAHPGDPLFGRFGFTMRYKSLRDWVNGPAGRRLGLTPIPDGPVNLRMLRRRLAIELAYRPGGLLAAKLHLKHALVAATEGYTARPGGSQAKLLAEINEHEQQRNLELVLTEFRNFQNGLMPSGPGARELIDSFRSIDDTLAEQARSAPKLLASDQELRNLLTKRARILHLGTANFCWFADPSRALCLRMAGTPTADKPLLGLCDSARCPQATHHPCHRPVWAAAADNTRNLLATLGPTRKAEKTRLHTDLDRATRILDQIDTNSAPTRTPTDGHHRRATTSDRAAHPHRHRPPAARRHPARRKLRHQDPRHRIRSFPGRALPHLRSPAGRIRATPRPHPRPRQAPRPPRRSDRTTQDRGHQTQRSSHPSELNHRGTDQPPQPSPVTARRAARRDPATPRHPAAEPHPASSPSHEGHRPMLTTPSTVTCITNPR